VLALGERSFKTGLLIGFIALAWITLWAWGQTSYGRHLHHAGMGAAMFAGGIGPVFFFAMGWTLMTVAMMLPTSLPLLGLFQTVLRSRENRSRLLALCVAGYLSIWVLFGFIAYLGTSYLYGLLDNVNFRSAILLIAGIYQFTPLKYHCLKKCRSPFSFISSHWHGRNAWAESFALGVHHGLFCIGCCWSLMLLMFLAVNAHILWMLALGTVMAVEKNVSWGKRISAPLGVVLLCAAVAVRFF
jgi:predicted metal-binding membrane protein